MNANVEDEDATDTADNMETELIYSEFEESLARVALVRMKSGDLPAGTAGVEDGADSASVLAAKLSACITTLILPNAHNNRWEAQGQIHASHK